MTILYALRHEYERAPGLNEVAHIGVYSNRQKAEQTIARLREQPGFSSYPDNFKIYEIEMNQEPRIGWRLPMVFNDDNQRRAVAMTIVYLLDLVREDASGNESSQLVGIYSSFDRAKAAREQLLRLPQFANYPGKLEISEEVVNRDSWTEGFVTMIGDQVIGD